MKILSASIVLLFMVGFVYQSYSSYIDSTSFDKREEMIDVGGYSLYVEDSGTGKVTVIFDAGMGDDSSAWNKVAAETSQFSRVITYDRAGLGWSEKSPNKRDSKTIVAELRISVNPIGRFGFIRSLFHLLFRPCQFYLK